MRWIVAGVLGSVLVVASCSFTSLDDLQENASAAGGGSASTSTGNPTAGGSTAGCGDAGVCVQDAGMPWEGSFFLFTTADGDPFSCPDGARESLYWQGPPKDPFTCAACTCGEPSGASCSQNPIVCYGAAGCTGSMTGVVNPDGCIQVTQSASCMVGEATLTAGGCTAGGGVPSAKPGWEQARHLCAAQPGKGACVGECVARPTGAAQLCVTGPPGGACPSGWSDLAIQAFGSVTDTRSCTACSCGNPVGSCSGGAYGVAGSFLECSAVPSLAGPGSCFQGGSYVNFAQNAVPSGACSPTAASVPTGEFVPTDPVSICCKDI